EAGATGLLPKTAWCPDILIYARNNGLILRDPVKGNRTKSGFKPGDVGLIQRGPGEANYSPNGAKHIFLVVKDLGNGVVQTIEGNASNSGSASGDGVYSLKRQLTDQIVILRPKYGKEEKWDGKSFPGASAFKLGQSHPAVTVLGQRLVAHGYGRFYSVGPGPTFGQADLKATKAFQKAQGWTGSDADGYPGPETWKRLMAGPGGKSGGPSKAALAAVARAKAEVSKPSKNWRRLCLNFVMTCWGFSPSGIPSAIEGWNRSKKKKTSGTPPKGAPVYWRGPTSAGHVAISDGGGYEYSNDFKRAGEIDRVKITDITKGWGATYLGWTEDYCGVRDLDLYAPAPPPPASGGTRPEPEKPKYDDDMEEFLMTADWKRYSTTKPQKLKKLGQWQYLYTTDKPNISFADGPARATGHVALVIHGKPGESVYFRVVEDDEDKKGNARRRATYSDHVEVTITPGSTYAKFPINVKAGGPKKGWKANWLRIQWHSSDPNCT